VQALFLGPSERFSAGGSSALPRDPVELIAEARHFLSLLDDFLIVRTNKICASKDLLLIVFGFFISDHVAIFFANRFVSRRLFG